MSDYQEQGRFFHILSHPARLQILNVLRGGEECVCHIQSVLGKRQAYVSQQLMVLREAGLVSVRKDGLNAYYRLADPMASDVLKVVLGPAEERCECAESACPRCGRSVQTTPESSKQTQSAPA